MIGWGAPGFTFFTRSRPNLTGDGTYGVLYHAKFYMISTYIFVHAGWKYNKNLTNQKNMVFTKFSNLGIPVPTSFPDPPNLTRVDPSQISPWSVNIVALMGPKTTNLTNFAIQEAPVPIPWLIRAIWHARIDPRSTFMCKISHWLVCCPWEAKSPNFTIFQLKHPGVATLSGLRESWMPVNNYKPYPT